ncbi:F0F1 ATP synthase subunit delta [Jatrophihabitans endophyticus]|uniref:F0F1 ATP synthase subunit delta n=1 Tax=Jatrophihabitans endophyticus TaxID=1206085 RepID=UPI001A04BBCF|nr:F0F1 ATP synthase subunit delta [Jatrophihabitans endophyticus]MBE7188862.1 F0F1 ATP synthase subunit delta [Jatrophihabitans endophyticus]
MRSASRQALEALREVQASEVGPRSAAATFTTLSDELYAIAALLVAQPRLRRTLGDPATDADGRASLLSALVGKQVAAHALAVASAAVKMRWSSPWDLTDALESAGDDALFGAAEREHDLDRVEDELFRFERILQDDGELTGLLDEYTVDPQRRVELLDELIDGKVTEATAKLLRHAVSSQRKRSILLAIDDLLEQAAARQDRSVARVVSAAPITEAQQTRLAAVLGELYGREISIRTALDPSLRGGLVVRIGDEVIDGSIANRINEAKTSLVG